MSPLGISELFIPHSGRDHMKLSADAVERAFHEHGINTFLVSTRMRNLCEGVRRLIRAGYRDQLILVSGFGWPFAGSAGRVLERHLRFLGTDRIDVWFLGWVQSRWYVRHSVWSAMCRLRDQGKARAVGISSHNRKLAAALARELPTDILMIRYNASHRGAETEIFDALADLGDRRPGIIAYTATRWSMLLDPLPDQGFPEPMTGPECYRFVLGHPMVDTVWCAARTGDELREDVVGVLEGPLDPQRREEICRFGDAVHAAARRGRRWMFGRNSR